jgi:DNA polymerase I
LLKRKASYTESMLEEADSDGRIHPSFNTLGARTARMSVSNPPLQQLPTKDREEDE